MTACCDSYAPCDGCGDNTCHLHGVPRSTCLHRTECADCANGLPSHCCREECLSE